MADSAAPADADPQSRSGQEDSPSSGKQIICMCFDFALDDMQSILAKNPNISFDRFLTDSGTGAKCTACLLDLEYYFVNLPRKLKKGASTDYSPTTTALPWRRRVYRWIDQRSPRQSVPLCDDVPVIAGPDIEQWVWLANYELLYTEDKSNRVPDFDVELRLFDADGAPVHQQRVELGLGTEWRGELGQYLPKPEPNRSADQHQQLSIGRLEIIRHAKFDGARGTTRPQIEIVTPVSSCAVHGQGAGHNTGNAFDLICHPEDDRVFVSLINPSSKPVEISMVYPADPMGQIELPPRTTQLTIPPKGARLHEVVLTEAEKQAYTDRLYKFAWHGAGLFKCHVIVASTDLDRFSIDHA